MTILPVSTVAIILASYGDLFFLGELYAFGALTAYLIASLSLIKLRFTEPNVHRPYQVPFNIKWNGVKVPLLAIAAVIGCAAMLFLVIWLHEAGRNFAILWFLVGGVHFFFYRNYREKKDAQDAVKSVRKMAF